MYIFGGTYSKSNHAEGVFITKNGLFAPVMNMAESGLLYTSKGSGSNLADFEYVSNVIISRTL